MLPDMVLDTLFAVWKRLILLITMKKLSYNEIKHNCLSPKELERLPKNPIYVVAHNIRSLFNVGSIFRTSDALRVEKLFLTGFTGHPPRDEIEKVALGSTETVLWEYNENIFEIIEILRKLHVNIVALEHTDESKEFQEFKYEFCETNINGAG